jgi:hypothetical protein
MYKLIFAISGYNLGFFVFKKEKGGGKGREGRRTLYQDKHFDISNLAKQTYLATDRL